MVAGSAIYWGKVISSEDARKNFVIMSIVNLVFSFSQFWSILFSVLMLGYDKNPIQWDNDPHNLLTQLCQLILKMGFGSAVTI